MQDYHLFIVSDGTGETAYRLLKAAMVQFGVDIVITRYANVREQSRITGILDAVETASCPALLVYTFVSESLRQAMAEQAQSRSVQHLDALGPLMVKLSTFFKKPPSAQPGLLHQVDEDYYARIDAIEYAIRHDDGRSVQDLETAEIVLVGVSRTSKTPLSIYLAQEGWKVANIPFVVDIKPPAELFSMDQNKIAGLTIQPQRLAEVRTARLRQLGVRESNYADLARIQQELEYSHRIFDQHPVWPVIDVTGKSLEEVSQEVLDELYGRRRRL